VVHLSPEWTADNLDALAKQVPPAARSPRGERRERGATWQARL